MSDETTVAAEPAKKKSIPLARLVPALIIGPGCWLGPYIVMNSLFLPKLVESIDPANKVSIVAMFATAGMIVAAISNVIAGNISDRTHTKFGGRTPIIMIGALGFMACGIGCSLASSIPALLIFWMLGQAALNFIVAPMVAWLDFAPEGGEATASSAYGGLGMALGNNGFNVVGALFLSQFRMGFAIFGVVCFVGVLISCLIVREPSNLGETSAAKDGDKPKEKTSIREVIPSWSKGRDYYLALIAKMFQGVGNFAITGYILYILSDYFGLGDADQQSYVQLINSIMFVLGLVMGFVAGPFSDKTGFLKLPVAFSTISLAIGALCMYLSGGSFAGIAAYAFFAGLGMGLWNSLDNLLNLKVIPNQDQVATFLGIYNLGNTVTQAIAPVIAAAVIGAVGYQGVFIVSIVFSLIGGICMLSVKSVKK